MKLVSFEHQGRSLWGCLRTDHIAAAGAEVVGRFPTLGDALRGGWFRSDGPAFTGAVHDLRDVRLLPPVPDPGKIICVGRNYGAHIAEAGLKRPDFPSLFIRFTDTLVASGDALVRPRVSEQFDFEGEVAVVIGASGRHIAEEDAIAHVFGYSIFNDASVRDVQLTHSLVAGKNFFRTGGFGPSIVTADEVPDYRSLSLTTRVNGVQMQQGCLADMLFNLEYLISYISRVTPLSPGDVILTGTPEGVGLARTPQLWLTPGDTVEVEVFPIGILTNSVTAEEDIER